MSDVTTTPETTRHLIGLLLGTENDWPRAFEALTGRLGLVEDGLGGRHEFATERVSIEPFDLTDQPRHSLVIDRLAYCTRRTARCCGWA